MQWGLSPISEGKAFITSLDKVIPDKGYVKGNVVFTQNRINWSKSNFTLDEIKIWMPEWYKKIMTCSWLTCKNIEFSKETSYEI